MPDYRAPETTVIPAARVPMVLLGVLAAADPAATELPEPRPGLAQQLRSLSDTLSVELPEAVLARALVAWTQLFGMISFELFGQFVGSVDPSDEFFNHAVAEMADFVGLPGPASG
jgi:hypothetical protein